MNLGVRNLSATRIQISSLRRGGGADAKRQAEVVKMLTGELGEIICQHPVVVVSVVVVFTIMTGVQVAVTVVFEV